MRYRMLVAIMVVLAVLMFGVRPMIGEAGLAASVARFITVNAKVLATLGALVAMFQFGSRDYMRRAWAWVALGSALLVEADLYGQLLGTQLAPTAQYLGRGLIVVGSNLATPIGLVFFARALSVAGLDSATSSRARLWATLAAAVVAVALTATSLVDVAQKVFGGDVRQVAMLASTLGDIASFVLLAPLVATVLALRGGALWWPFMLLATSTLGWLVYDGAGMITAAVGARGAFAVSLQDAARICGCLFLAGAGLAQRWVVAPSAAAAGAEAATKAA